MNDEPKKLGGVMPGSVYMSWTGTDGRIITLKDDCRGRLLDPDGYWRGTLHYGVDDDDGPAMILHDLCLEPERSWLWHLGMGLLVFGLFVIAAMVATAIWVL